MALSAYYSGSYEEAYARAAAAAKALPPGDTSWNSMAVLTVFAEGRWKAMKKAAPTSATSTFHRPNQMPAFCLPTQLHTFKSETGQFTMATLSMKYRVKDAIYKQPCNPMIPMHPLRAG